MNKIINAVLVIFFTLSIQDAVAQRELKTENVCYAGDPFRTNMAFDRCDEFCTENGYRGADGWRCGSDIKCQGSRCICICQKRRHDEDKRDRHHKKEEERTIKIPLGDNLNFEIRP